MKKELDTSKASFKLDLIETANADPVMTAADLKLLAAYMSVMEWPSGKAWLSITLGCAKTGLSERQYWTSRTRLAGKNEAKRPYMIAAGGSGTVDAFKLINPWRDEAIEHVAAMTAFHRERLRQQKAKSRLKKITSQTSDVSLQPLQGHNPGCHCKICSPVTATIADKYPSDSTPRKEGAGKNNPGSNVLPFGKRKAS
ncbi:hypothetical protein NKI32_19850 [Mesorhizobium sp. M0761]|uniref:hypothetical protein n=1 Tax=unclassified Mesorhizobium TaxID=325217 RepID=UPI0003D04F80|nr:MULTISPECIES: hypothetical protein [unclassified Mesorhizobium]ESZ17550.1 hypothetical protein X735_01445 [Mesorhizobium sp. L2C085B000]ESZ70021.1 hypothetical protein X727_15700 [Mesorhizobium sp. L103C119B0]ESZ78690.1 hypothetical protein X726_05025 [Mesorhizobium sp. L103C105A0]